MAHIQFFHRQIDTAAIETISEIMSSAGTTLQIEMCYVTEFGTKLLQKHAANLLRDGSFIIVANEPINDIAGLNKLAELRPESVRHITAKSDAKEKTAEGLMHAKLIYAENGTNCTLWVGSNNFTKCALLAVNIEAAVIVSGSIDEQVFVDAREHLRKVKKLSEEGPIKIKPDPIPLPEIIVVECEASPELIKELSTGNHSFCVYLRHDIYDRECIPSGKTNREVRLYVYEKGSLTQFGPIEQPLLVRTGHVIGVAFTSKSPRNGSKASWNEKPGFKHMTIEHESPDDPKTALVAKEGKHTDEEAWTISAFIIDGSPKNEIFVAAKLKPTLSGEKSKHEIQFDNRFFANPEDTEIMTNHKNLKVEKIKVTYIKNQKPGYATKYYGNIHNIHTQNLSKWAAKYGLHIDPLPGKTPYLFIRRGYILDEIKIDDYFKKKSKSA